MVVGLTAALLGTVAILLQLDSSAAEVGTGWWCSLQFKHMQSLKHRVEVVDGDFAMDWDDRSFGHRLLWWLVTENDWLTIRDGPPTIAIGHFT